MSFDSFINVIICPVGWKSLGVKRFHFTDLERTFCAPVHCAGAKKPFYSRWVKIFKVKRCTFAGRRKSFVD